MSSNLITLQDAAGRLSLSTKTVRRLISRGELPARKIGARILIPADALDALGRPVTIAAAR
jgi:excisionase family DNA binding protein